MSSSEFSLCRPGAVRKTSSEATPARRATAQCFRTAFAAAAVLVSETRPVLSISSPSPRRTRSFSIGTITPSSTDATSSRVVFDPMSTTPIRMLDDARSPVGRR